jgi:hypothetical protein
LSSSEVGEVRKEEWKNGRERKMIHTIEEKAHDGTIH